MGFDVFLWKDLLKHLWVELVGFGRILDVLPVEVEHISSVGLDKTQAGEAEDEAGEEQEEVHVGETSSSC